jgi:hypothetical protein
VSPTQKRLRNQGGFSSTIGLVGMVVSLGIVAVLVAVGMNAFGGGGSGQGSGTSASSSILSRSSAESQIKLCAEGRDSSYGDPPSSAQQAKCVRDLLGQVSTGGSSIPGSP